MTTYASDNLQALYDRRFSGKKDYRQRVWSILVADCFSKLIPAGGAVLDLGCGRGEFIRGEFINRVTGVTRYAMDLNPDSKCHLDSGIQWFQRDCSKRWPLADNALSFVFTSNFFEHLTDKGKLLTTLEEAHRCLRPGGRIVALGPNIKYVGGAYWDFWDHHIALTETSMVEILQTVGFRLQRVVPRF